MLGTPSGCQGQSILSGVPQARPDSRHHNASVGVRTVSRPRVRYPRCMATTQILTHEIAEALRCPFVPEAIERLATAEGYLEHLWPRLAASVETAGFLGSALYMADMALDAVEEVYEPLRSPEEFPLDEAELEQVRAVLDVFHRVQPQLLLLVAALSEAWGRPRVGGHGRAEPREPSERERRHLQTEVRFASPDTPPLPEVVAALNVEAPPQLYRAVAVWPGYLVTAWEELQHLTTYPDFRRRGRALYYYARSGARFLAEPVEANPESLRAAGLSDAAIAQAKAALDASLPALATMVMHATAMRRGLGLTEREVVKPQ
ncbi:MAG: hypothetical protein GEU80_09630 [Dehalococcoidia bacterium]|nr:hypothetical protein [Dehalococcoidia bacterium]